MSVSAGGRRCRRVYRWMNAGYWPCFGVKVFAVSLTPNSLSQRRIAKPSGRTFDLPDYRVRAAVRQALKNVACASGARSRGSAGPVRAKPLYCQFDLPNRCRPISLYEAFLVHCHLVSPPSCVCRGTAPLRRHGREQAISRSIRHAGCKAAHGGLTGSPRKRASGRADIRRQQFGLVWFPMTEPCGIDVLVSLNMGSRWT
jgi:hypothetical protein